MSSACYEPASLNMSVKNPFMQEAVFKIILLEMPEGPSEAEKEAEAARRKKQQHAIYCSFYLCPQVLCRP